MNAVLSTMPHPPSLITTRSEPSTSSDSNTSNLCVSLSSGGNLVVSKHALIAGLAVCVIITLSSIAAATLLLYREYARRKEAKAARTWGRKSHFDRRVSMLRKEVDGQYSRQYSGCLQNEPENPEMEMGSAAEPVELMLEERLHEAPAVPAKSVERERRKSERKSLFFDQGIGVWLPKR